MKDLPAILSLLLPTFFLLSCFLTFGLSFDSSQSLQSQCLDEQRSVLLQLQQGLEFFHNFTFSSKAELWDISTYCCSWKGVTCDVLGHVIGLDLSYKNLSGSFHSIFDLHHLQRLNLAGNSFNTTLFPSQFDRLANLTHLNLSGSCFHGQIPLGISYLTRLVSLDLSYQDECCWRNDQTVGFYCDGFPTLKLERPNFKTLIEKMKSLRELCLDGVNISSQSSKWCETTTLALPKLRVLNMPSCGLTGSLCSSLSSLHFLSILDLDNNPISYLPHNFLEISSRLVSLSLSYCNLSGYFSIQVFLLPKMQTIDISRNFRLMVQLPEFPLNSSLQDLSLGGTNFSGKLPESLGNLKLLTYLDLDDCNLSGYFPIEVLLLPKMQTIDISSNQNLSGQLPEFPLNSTLQDLSLIGTNFSGKLPESLGNLKLLTYLDLGDCNFVGQIPSAIANLTNLESLDLTFNSLSGSIPKSIFNLPALEVLLIGYNNFGPLNLGMFSRLKNLRVLDLSNLSLSIGSDNKSIIFPQLEDLSLSSCNHTEFPEFIKTQDKLAYLDLSNNQIHGFVPNWLWKSTLQELDLSFNAIDFPLRLCLVSAFKVAFRVAFSFSNSV